ncbi:DUF4176 domain-containing protein [Streptococcus parasanguinis]|jgi:BH0980 protein|uniref:DUF4176 domain-containing protein n=1 Tax=Streptococcus parasanguinis TaxID=1318 RepID=UPI00189A3581|nr:DUF4176 domain-containing protein [Streptococcus parasanguinis]MDB8615412.1 DUF4176 domain-containing protein [Streptococcus parasanguinis]MDB8621921.1 DUF4176 domain-containing protein [Streptococcus parasanguinis]MDB8623673.1 DUF4176 domain-containing protein [Streptococcus parasanguinis]
MKKNKLLTLGSVVYLEGGTIPVMIVLRHPIFNIKEKMCYFDYAAVNQLTGLEPDKITYFNHEDISEVVFEGYVSENEKRIQKGLAEWIKEHPEIPKGDVDQINLVLYDDQS